MLREKHFHRARLPAHNGDLSSASPSTAQSRRHRDARYEVKKNAPDWSNRPSSRVSRRKRLRRELKARYRTGAIASLNLRAWISRDVFSSLDFEEHNRIQTSLTLLHILSNYWSGWNIFVGILFTDHASKSILRPSFSRSGLQEENSEPFDVNFVRIKRRKRNLYKE